MNCVRVAATKSFHGIRVDRPRRFCTRAVTGESSETALKRSQLGKSDLVVSEASLGCMRFGTQNTEDESHRILSAAFDMGVNFFDTSEMYPVMPSAETIGRSSLYLGSWLKTASVKRDDVVIATKVAGYLTEERGGHMVAARVNSEGPGETRVTAKSIEAAVDTELYRLGVDYIDLMQIHWPDRYVPLFGSSEYLEKNEREESVPFEEQVSGMAAMIKKGKIRHWGLSNETAYGTMMMCFAADKFNVPRPISIQNSFSLIDRRFSTDLAEVCGKNQMNIPLIPWSPAAGGVLSGKYLNGQLPEGSRMALLGLRYSRFISGRVEEAVKEYVRIAKEYEVTPIQLAYLFCKAQPYVGSTLIGAASVDQLKEDIDGFSKDLPQEALLAINAVHQNNPNPQNTYET
eukprot:g6893.t1